MDDAGLLPGGHSPANEEREQLKRQIIATAAVCFVFAIVGFVSQGPSGAAGFGSAAFIASAIFIPCLADECSLFGSVLIVCTVFGALGLLAGGINGLFYGVGLAFAVSALVFCLLFVLEHSTQKWSTNEGAENPESEQPPRIGSGYKPSKASARLPTPSEAEAMIDRQQIQALEEALRRLGKTPLGGVPTSSEAEAMVDDQLAAAQEAWIERRQDPVISRIVHGNEPRERKA
jgi:hypothetical protein